MTALLKAELLRLGYLLCFFAAVGWIGHVTVQLLFVGLAVYLGLHLRNLHKLHHWLKTNPQDYPPNVSGVWEDIAQSIYRLQKQERAAQLNLLGIIQRARESVAALDEAVVLIDSQGNLEWWNAAAERLLGFKTPVDMGKPITNLIRDPAFVDFFEKGGGKDALKLPSWTQANHYVQYEVTRFGDNDRLLIAYDITRLHQLEQIRKDFVANVSHELRTPITVLSGFLETITHAGTGNAELLTKSLAHMTAQAARMQGLVEDLLTLSRLEDHEARSAPAPVNVPDLVQALLLDATQLSAGRHRIERQVGEAWLLGARDELASAFGNLITNAVRYTPPGGVITISWGMENDGPVFRVADTGEGIAPEHIPRLTERFYRVDRGRSQASGGTGLGLAIVKHALIRHDGRLDIQSSRDADTHGSTFTIHFPAARLCPPQPQLQVVAA